MVFLLLMNQRQQRAYIARGLIVDYPILLLVEPTASLEMFIRDSYRR